MNPATKELLPGIEEGSMYASEALNLPNLGGGRLTFIHPRRHALVITAHQGIILPP